MGGDGRITKRVFEISTAFSICLMFHVIREWWLLLTFRSPDIARLFLGRLDHCGELTRGVFEVSYLVSGVVWPLNEFLASGWSSTRLSTPNSKTLHLVEGKGQWPNSTVLTIAWDTHRKVLGVIPKLQICIMACNLSATNTHLTTAKI